MTGSIRTLGGDLDPGAAGPSLVHEHLIIDSPLVEGRWPEIHLDSVDDAVAEVDECVAAGVRLMVDAMPAGAGRGPERLGRISIFTGMRIVAATGMHTEKYYEGVEWAWTEGPEELADRFALDIEVGMDAHDYRGERVERTEARAGLIKVASSEEEPTARDLRLFRGAAIAHRRTGAPVLTHTEGGRGGLRQVEELGEAGVDPHRIALSHTDKVADPVYHRDLLDTGTYLVYDQALRWSEGNQTADLIATMVEAGYGSRLLVGTDGARRSLWVRHGGSPGLAWGYHGLAALLADRGLSSENIARMYVANPARYLSSAY